MLHATSQGAPFKEKSMTKKKDPSSVESSPIKDNTTRVADEDIAHKKINPISAAMFGDYEAGLMSDEEVIAFFQSLINTGMAWSLQGHYGRMATHLIKSGVCNEAVPRNN